MFIIRQSTSTTVLIGPYVDDTDFKTAETGLTIANTDIRVSKNGANIVAKNSGGGTHDENGWYAITLDATDSSAVGTLQIHSVVAGALPVWMEFQVVEENVYDAIYVSGAGIGTDVASILTDTGTTIPATITTIDTNVDAILVDTGTTIPATITTIDANVDAILVDTGTTLDTKINTIDTNVDAILVDTGTTIPATLTTIDSVGDDTNTKVGTIIFATDTLEATCDAILVDTATTIPATIATIDTNVDAILLDTGTTGVAITAGSLAGETVAAVSGAVGSVTGHTPQTGDTYALANGTAGFVAIDTVVDAILLDTGTTGVAANVTQVDGVALASHTAGYIPAEDTSSTQGVPFTVSTTSNTLTTCSTNLSGTYTVDNTFINRTIVWTGGTYAGSVSFIEAYAGSTGVLTFSEGVGVPANTDTGIIF